MGCTIVAEATRGRSYLMVIPSLPMYVYAPICVDRPSDGGSFHLEEGHHRGYSGRVIPCGRTLAVEARICSNVRRLS